MEVVSEEVEAIGGAETHVRQVIDRLHAITKELDSYRRRQTGGLVQEEVGLRHANKTHIRAALKEPSIVMAAKIFP